MSNEIEIQNNIKRFNINLATENIIKYKITIDDNNNVSDNYVNIKFFINTDNTDGSGNILIDSYLTGTKIRSDIYNFKFTDIFVDKLIKMNTDTITIGINYNILSGETGEIVGSISKLNLPIVSRIYGSEDVPIKTLDGKLLLNLESQTVDISGQTINVQGGIDISGQTVDISGQTVIVSGITFDSADLNVDISGQRVDISGQTVVVQGGIDISGQRVDISGQTINVQGGIDISGQRVDISGQTVVVSGITFDTTDLNVDVSGQTVDISGQTLFTNDITLQNTSNNINTSVQNLKFDLSGLNVFDSTINANVVYSTTKLNNIYANSSLTNVYLDTISNDMISNNNKLDTIQLICSNIVTTLNNNIPRTFYNTEYYANDISANECGVLIDVSNIPISANVSFSAKSDVSNNKSFGWVGNNTNDPVTSYLITDIKSINNSLHFPSFNFSNGIPVKYIGIYNNTDDIFSNVTYKIYWSI